MNNLVIPYRFFQNVKAFSDKAAVLTKVSGIFRPVTYHELGTIIRAIALVLDSWGIRKGDRIALMSDNREEWFMSDMACISIGAVCVPVYPTLSAMQINELMKHSEPRMIFFSTQDLLKKIRESNYHFESVVSFDQIPGETDVQWLRDTIESGKRIDAEKPERFQTLMDSVKESDLACINYTSGTTGSPKGVMLSHANFVKDVDNSVKMLHIYPEDTFLSFLPLSHVLERMGGYYVPMLLGATVGFAESIEKVIENMSEVHPTILISVPRLFEKIYATVMSSVQSGSSLKKKIFYWGLKAGKERMKADIEGFELGWWKRKKVNLADKLVFSKLQQKTGGRLQRFVSGGAPLSPEIAEFLYSAGLRIYEGYGLTETSPVIAVNGPGNVRLGSVGRAVPETEFKIATDAEILVKGPQVMVGYYKNETATHDVIDADGFFHTGDIGHFDDDNFLYITDRKKNLIITAGGKNVAPQPIEEALKLSPYIAESVLIGDRKNFISALTVLDQAAMKKWAEAHQIPFEPYTDFIRREEVLKLIESEIENQTTHFSRFEKVKKFRIIPKDFTIDDGEITPSLKVKKKVVLEKYAALVDEMYRE